MSLLFRRRSLTTHGVSGFCYEDRCAPQVFLKAKIYPILVFLLVRLRSYRSGMLDNHTGGVSLSPCHKDFSIWCAYGAEYAEG